MNLQKTFDGQEFHDFVVGDLLAEVQGINSRRMFGCWGIFKDGKMFGIIDEGELYLKTNKETEKVFKKAGSSPIKYKSKGKTVTMSYWRIPSEGLDNRMQFLEWVDLAVSSNARLN